MGGFKQCYYITSQQNDSCEEVYLTFGNRTYARKIFCALKEYYQTVAGYEAELSAEEGLLYLHKIQTDDTPEDNVTFRFYQKHLMWQGELPDDIKFLEDYAPKVPEKINGKVAQETQSDDEEE